MRGNNRHEAPQGHSRPWGASEPKAETPRTRCGRGPPAAHQTHAAEWPCVLRRSSLTGSGTQPPNGGLAHGNSHQVAQPEAIVEEHIMYGPRCIGAILLIALAVSCQACAAELTPEQKQVVVQLRGDLARIRSEVDQATQDDAGYGGGRLQAPLCSRP